ncbi:hypothetical protein AB0F91_44655 [Amycolatopsis sp. NPDC023774]|uniref:hypothetical protein n=1 Tax=Amycolatopsis sp. NPDC023774 TaxID=3155015 RepID=UPI0033ED4493
MSRRFVLLTATAVAAFGLTACGAHATPAAHAPPAITPHAHPEIVPITPPEFAPATGAAATYLAKKVGERVGITNRDGSSAVVDFWITKISVDPTCDPSSHRAVSRHTVVLDVTVTTYTDKVAGQRLGPFIVLPGVINPFSLSTTGTIGTRVIETDRCVTPLKKLPSTYVPGHAYTGQIAFATPYDTGKVQVTQSSGYFPNGNVGWEWSY